MKVDLNEIRNLIPVALEQPSFGDEWLDNRYMECLEPYYKLFYLLAKAFLPRYSVELGAQMATAAAHLAAGNPNGTVVTIDIHETAGRDKTLEAVAQYDNLVYIQGYTCDPVVVEKVARRGSIDLLYIDAEHKYTSVKQEWNTYMPLLADEALVICDDIFDAPGYTVDMVKFWNEIVGYEKFLDSKVHRGPLQGFVRFVRCKL